jgi:TonB family protein
VCIATDGHVASAAMLDSTKYTGYDATLLSAVQRWRYRPYLLDGAPLPACSTVTFVYTIKTRSNRVGRNIRRSRCVPAGMKKPSRPVRLPSDYPGASSSL